MMSTIVFLFYMYCEHIYIFTYIYIYYIILYILYYIYIILYICRGFLSHRATSAGSSAAPPAVPALCLETSARRMP